MQIRYASKSFNSRPFSKQPLISARREIMSDETKSDGNAKKMKQLSKVLKELLDEVLHHGFFGIGVIEIGIQDGTIQHIRRRVERIEK
jgi:hypothetical protein